MMFRFNYSANKYNIEDAVQVGVAMHELMMLNDPYACINGIVYIIDFAQASTSHYLQMTPNFCKKFISFMEKSMPMRIKTFCYINTSPAAQQFFKLLFSFFSEKLKARVSLEMI